MISLQSTGSLSQCVVDSDGNFRGTIFLSGQSNFISGTLDSFGNGKTTASRAAEGLSDLAVALHLNLGGPLEMTGTISSLDPGNSWSSSLIAEPQTNSLSGNHPISCLTLPATQRNGWWFHSRTGNQRRILVAWSLGRRNEISAKRVRFSGRRHSIICFAEQPIRLRA